MIRIIAAASLLTAATIMPSLAQDMACDEASLMKMTEQNEATTDEAMKEQKEMAMKELAMAKEAMAAKDEAKCKTHMDAAMKGMEMKK